jgi:hypothetical protein
MKDGLKYLVGKHIVAVVVANNPRPPHEQVFLVFPDGKCFEFWGESFSCCAGLDDAARIERYVASSHGEIVRAYGEQVEAESSLSPPSTGPDPRLPYHVTAPETLEGLMSPDLQAWIEAKAAIDKARER